MKRKLFILSLTVCAVLCLSGATACGEDTDEGGDTPYGLEFVLDENSHSYTLSGKGSFSDTQLVIPLSYNNLPITSIGYRALANCKTLEKITIPSTVTQIGEYAFSECDKLEKVTIAQGLKNIGNSAFENCTALQSVTLPDSVESVGYYAFSGCTLLMDITLPDSVTTVGGKVFEKCNNLTVCCEVENKPDGWSDGWNGGRPVIWDCDNNDVADDGSIYAEIDGTLYRLNGERAQLLRQLKDDVAQAEISKVTYNGKTYNITAIGDYAFYNCSRLEEVTVDEGVTSIGTNAFKNCLALTDFTIPRSIEFVGKDVFSNCYLSIRINYTGNIASWCENEISGRQWLMERAGTLYIGGKEVTGELIIPNGVKSIGSFAFRNCSSLKYVTIPDGVTSVGNAAFGNCSKLTSITIPESVTSIGDSVFARCGSLTSVTIPAGVTGIGESTFEGCSSLTSVTIPAGVTSIGKSAFWNTGLTDIVFNGTKEQWKAIKKADTWDGTTDYYTVHCSDGNTDKYGR